MRGQTQATHKPSRMRRFLRHPIWAPLNNREAWDRITTAIHPLWSLLEVRARVIRVVDETSDVRSIWLKPNARFKGFRPGQHVLLELDINGVRQARCFSLSAAPASDGLIRLTIKRKEHGPVSSAAHALTVGSIVRMSQAQGVFYPTDGNSKLLLLSAGSGVTPMMSILQALTETSPNRDVVLVHSGSVEADTVFAKELRQLASQWPALKLHLHASQEQGRLTAESIVNQVPDWQDRETLLCGPDGFMRLVETLFAAAGRSALLKTESFGRRAAPVDPDAAAHEVTIGNPEQVFTVQAGQSLLEGAEAAGLKPRFGCRRGICRSCQCQKRSGTVTNLLTGQVSGPGPELIQLCISTPQSALELDL